MTSTIDFSSTSSGPNGISALKGFLECPARASAARKERLARGEVPWPLDSEVKEVKGKEVRKPVNTTVGSIYGALMEQWSKGTPVAPSAKFTWDGVDIEESHRATCAEARRLADAAMKHYGSPEQMGVGELVATEMPVKIPESLFGVEITGNIDRVTRTPAGIWIRDWKTEGKEDQNLKDKFGLSLQLWVYALAYELETGEKPVGVGIDCCIKTDDPKFRRFDYEGVTERRFEWLKMSFGRIKAAMADPKPNPNISFCWAYYKPCAFLLDSSCSLC
jgi:hypothetical protein